MTAHTRSSASWLAALLILLLSLVFFASYRWIEQSNFTSGSDALRVDQVWANARQLEGQVIRVRGKIEFIIEKTLVLCCPPTCDCNESGGSYYLVSESEQVYNHNCSAQDTINLPIDCGGNDCSLTCTPFYPQEAQALELVGRLQVSYRNGELCSLSLSEIILDESRQLVEGEWKPIAEGTFTIPLNTPSVSPLCTNYPTTISATPTPNSGKSKPANAP